MIVTETVDETREQAEDTLLAHPLLRLALVLVAVYALFVVLRHLTRLAVVS